MKSKKTIAGHKKGLLRDKKFKTARKRPNNTLTMEMSRSSVVKESQNMGYKKSSSKSKNKSLRCKNLKLRSLPKIILKTPPNKTKCLDSKYKAPKINNLSRKKPKTTMQP